MLQKCVSAWTHEFALKASMRGTITLLHEQPNPAHCNMLGSYGEYLIVKSKFSFVENVSLKKQALLLEEVQKLNKENAEKSGQQLTPGHLDLEAGVPPKDQLPDASACNLVDFLREDSQKDEVVEATSEEMVGEKVQQAEALVTEKEPELEVEDVVKEKEEEKLPVAEEKKEEVISSEEEAKASELPVAQEDEEETTTTR